MTNKELDKFIAEKVMGWKYIETLLNREKIYVISEDDVHHIVHMYVENWQPTQQIEQAFQVVDKIHETWLFSRRQAFLKSLQDVISESVSELTDVDQKIAWPDLFFYITPKAVCLAAKKAVEMEGR